MTSGGVRWLDDPDKAAGWRGEPLAWLIDPADRRRASWLAGAAESAADRALFAGRADAGYRIERQRLARLLVARATGRHPDTIVIARDADGAPNLRGPRHIGLAGSAGWILIAIGDEPIGADIEIATADPPLWDMLTTDETAIVRSAADPPHAWLRHWVAKEAHAKRCGDPRRAVPADIAIDGDRATSPQGISRLAWHERGGTIAAVAQRG